MGPSNKYSGLISLRFELQLRDPGQVLDFLNLCFLAYKVNFGEEQKL